MIAPARVIIGDSRSMHEIADQGIDLIVTSPPYWHIKDYGIPDQIGYGQSLHEYLRDLYCVWRETFRVLRTGARLCVNIGDQFARSVTYGRYKVIPLHAEVITQCEKIGFDFMGSIIWQKRTTMNTTGGASVMGSFPYPPNGIVEIDYEYIHILKKPGKSKRVLREIKEASKMKKEEWKKYFSGHWRFGGARKIGHEAMFPEELPTRLIRMFSFVGDTVLDPFVGSGTTVKAALALGRNAIGYEVNQEFIDVIRKKLGVGGDIGDLLNTVDIVRRCDTVSLPEIDYLPGIQDATPATDRTWSPASRERLYRVTAIIDEHTLQLDTGLNVSFLGVNVDDTSGTTKYLHEYLLGKQVFLRFNDDDLPEKRRVSAYVYLKNKIFVNAYLIKSSLGSPDPSENHRLKDEFRKIENQR